MAAKILFGNWSNFCPKKKGEILKAQMSPNPKTQNEHPM